MRGDSGTHATSNPYPGLRPFRIEEDYLFFGREEQTGELLKLLREHRFLAVVGASGSGKSSLVRAGLIPALHRGTMSSAGSSWEVVVQRPGGNPIRNLAQALCSADLYDPEDPESVRRVVATLNHSTQGLVEAYRESDIEQGANLLVVVDQFEELFRFSQSDSESRDESRTFVSLLIEASQQNDVPLYIVVTMRSDYLGECSQIRGLAEAVNEGEYLIPRLNRVQLQQAIEGPAKVGSGRISHRLIQRLLNDVGDDPDQLPVLQHALMRTWDARGANEMMDIEHYVSIGKVDDALSRHADEIFENLPAGHCEVAEKIFKALTEKGSDNRGIRRPTRLSSLVAIAGGNRKAVLEILEAYRAPGVTFLMPGVNVELSDTHVIDLSHESLMRVWRRLRAWVEEEAQSARIFRRLADTAVLRSEKKASLYRDPDLQIALSWRETEQPNTAWASQYTGGFDEAFAFLDESREAVARVDREREAARERELEQIKTLADARTRAARNFRRFSIGVAVLAIAAVILAVQAIQLRKRAELSQQDALSSARTAMEEANNARLAEEHAFKLAATAKHEQGVVWLERARGLLDEKRHLGAKILAARSLGFEGFGRESKSDAFRQQYPVLLREESPEAEEARRLILESPEHPTVFQNPASLTATMDFKFVAWDPTGRYIAAADTWGNTGRGSIVSVWNVATGERVAHRDLEDHVFSLRFSQDGNSILYFSREEIVRLNFAAAEASWVTHFESNLVSSAISNDGLRLAVADVQQRIHLLDMASGQVSAVLDSTSIPWKLEFHPTQPVLVAGFRTGKIRVWNLDDAEDPVEQSAHNGRIQELCMTADGSRLVSGSSDGTIKIWPMTDGILSAEPEATWGGFQLFKISSIKAHPSQPVVAVATVNGAIQLRNLPEGNVIKMLGSFSHQASQIDFSPNGDRLVAAMSDKSLRIWNVESGKELTQHEQSSMSWISGMDFSPDGRSLAWGSQDNSALQLTDLASGETLEIPKIRNPYGLLYSPVGSRLASITGSEINIFDMPDRGLYWKLLRPGVQQICWSPDGTLLATVAKSGSVRIWDVEARRALAALTGHTDALWAVDFSPDGRFLASAGSSGRIILWDVANRKISRRLESPGSIWALAFSTDGNLLFTAGAQGKIALWDLVSEEPRILVELGEGGKAIRAIDVSADGSMIASGGDDRVIRIWDIRKRSLLATLDGHRGWIRHLRFAPDSRSLASSSRDRTVRLWEIDRDVRELIKDDENDFFGAQFLDNRTIVTGGRNKLQFIDRASRTTIRSIHVEAGRVIHVAASPQGRYVVGGNEHAITLFEVDTGTELMSFEGDAANNPGSAFDSLERYFAVAFSKTIHIWLFDKGAKKKIARPANIWSLAFGPEGALYTGDTRGMVTIMEADSWAVRSVLKASGKTITRLAVSKDGSHLATVGHDGALRLWSIESLKLLREIPIGDRLTWFDVAFHPGGKIMATVSSRDGIVRIWNVQSGREMRHHESGIYHAFDLGFSPDGKTLVAGGLSTSLLVCEIKSQERRWSDYANLLTSFRIEGRKVLPSHLDNLYVEKGIALRPRTEGTHLSLLARETETSEDRAQADSDLFHHYLRNGNSSAAAAVMQNFAEIARIDASSALADQLASEADSLCAQGNVAVALSKIDLAMKCAPDSLAVSKCRARVFSAAGRQSEAQELIQLAFDKARKREAWEDALSLGRERVKMAVAKKDRSAAKARFAEILEIPGVQTQAEIMQYVGQVHDLVLEADFSQEKQRRLAQALSMGGIRARLEYQKTVDLSLFPALSQLTRYENGAREAQYWISKRAKWKYRDEADPPEESWYQPGYDDSKWPSGNAPLGFGDSRENTSMKIGYISYYARQEFTISEEAFPKSGAAVLRYARDDGVVIYLNGQEIHRDNMPKGPIGHKTAALLSISRDAEAAWHEVPSSSLFSALRPGKNLLAVEVHQSSAASSDVHFQAELTSELTLQSYLAAMTDADIDAAVEAGKELFPDKILEPIGEAIRFEFYPELDSAARLTKDSDEWLRRARVQRALGRLETSIEAFQMGITVATSAQIPEARARADFIDAELHAFLIESGQAQHLEEIDAAWVAKILPETGAIRINAGGERYETAGGEIWHGDRCFTDGKSFKEGTGAEFTRDIPGTEDDALYQTERVFINQRRASYSFAVPAGMYRVRLHFAELYHRVANQKIQDVVVEGNVVLSDFNAFTEAGGFGKPFVHESMIELKESPLVIELIRKTGNQQICAIEVIVVQTR